MKTAICLFAMLLISSVPALAGESHSNGGNTHAGGGHIPARGPEPARTSAPVREAPANRDNPGGQPSDARRSFLTQPNPTEWPHLRAERDPVVGHQSGRE